MAQALPPETLFVVDFSTDNRGGCQTVGRTRIQDMLNEAVELARVGVQLVDDYGSQVEANRLLDSFVRGNEQGHRDFIKGNYELVRDFLVSNQNVPPGGKPYLFCSDTWLERHDMTSEARDVEGNSFPRPDLSGLPALIRDVPDYLEVRRQSAGKTPYWSPFHMQYLFDYSYGPGRGYCYNTNHQGVTQHLILPATITLCPVVFQSTVTLGSVGMNPLSSALIPAQPQNIPNNAQRLSQVLPASMTLFHELFHLIMGSENSYPDRAGGELYEIVDMGRLTPGQAERNPETYAAMAVAYWHTRNISPVGGNRVEFYGFFATRG